MNFISYLNDIHPSIKLTHEHSHQTVNFLDTLLHIDENRRIYTNLYEKLTDTHLYLHYTSSHHEPCKSKGPYGQYLRLRHICSKDEDFRYNSKKLTEFYIKRGYPIKRLTKHFNRANKYKQDDLLDTKPREATETPVMVTNYNPQNPDIKILIMRNWNIISNSQDCGHLFPKLPILGYRRLPNLRDLMTNAKIDFPKQHQEERTINPQICRCTTVSRHFTQQNHKVTHMEFSVLEWCTRQFGFNETGLRRKHELAWNFKLHSLVPLGINQHV